MVYITIIILITISSLIFTRKYTKENLGVYILLTIVLVLFVGLRVEVGYDYNNYKLLFEYVEPIEEIITGKATNEKAALIADEKGYLFLNSIAKTLFGNNGFRFVLLISSVLSISGLAYVIYKLSSYPMLSIIYAFAMNMLQQHMGQMRQAIAVSFVLLSVLCILKNKKWLFLLNILIGMLFHITAIVILPFYWIRFNKIYLAKYRKILIIALLLSIFIGLSGIIGNTIKSIINIFGWPTYIKNIIDAYILSSKYGSSLGLGLAGIQRIVVVLISLLFYDKIIEDNSNLKLIIGLFYVSAIFYFLLNDFSVIAGRLFLPLRYSEIILLPSFINLSNNKILKILIFLFIILFSILVATQELIGKYSTYFPYSI